MNMPFDRNISKLVLIDAKTSEMIKEMLNNPVEFFCAISTELWRLRKKIKLTTQITNSADWTSISDSIDRLWIILEQKNLEVIDHTNTPYTEGMSVEVLHVEENKKLDKGIMLITETVSPTICFQSKVIKPGCVVVTKGPEKDTA